MDGTATELRLPFGDAEYRFHLPMRQIEEIERLTGSSIARLHEQLEGMLGLRPPVAAPRVADLAKIIRCAAIGGGRRWRGDAIETVGETEAERLVADYVKGRPFEEYLPVAWAILNAAIFGRTPQPPGAR